MSELKSLKQRVAVVTGSGSGIGRAIALRLAAEGAKVAVADLDFESAEQTAAVVTVDGGQAKAFAVDVSDQDSVRALSELVAEDSGRPADLIINNAGWSTAEPFLANSSETWERLVGINLMGPVFVCREFLAPLIDAGQSGKVINVVSDAGRVGSSGETVYAGAKGGVIAFTKSLAREMARHQVCVNCVSPGPTDTPLFQSQPEKLRHALTKAIPFRRLGQPEDIANAVAYFASDEASFVTGQVLSVSGGLTMVD